MRIYATFLFAIFFGFNNQLLADAMRERSVRYQESQAAIIAARKQRADARARKSRLTKEFWESRKKQDVAAILAQPNYRKWGGWAPREEIIADLSDRERMQETVELVSSSSPAGVAIVHSTVVNPLWRIGLRQKQVISANDGKATEENKKLVVSAINGKALKGIEEEEFLELLIGAVRDSNEFTLRFHRGRQTYKMSYRWFKEAILEVEQLGLGNEAAESQQKQVADLSVSAEEPRELNSTSIRAGKRDEKPQTPIGTLTSDELNHRRKKIKEKFGARIDAGNKQETGLSVSEEEFEALDPKEDTTDQAEELQKDLNAKRAASEKRNADLRRSCIGGLRKLKVLNAKCDYFEDSDIEKSILLCQQEATALDDCVNEFAKYPIPRWSAPLSMSLDTKCGVALKTYFTDQARELEKTMARQRRELEEVIKKLEKSSEEFGETQEEEVEDRQPMSWKQRLDQIKLQELMAHLEYFRLAYDRTPRSLEDLKEGIADSPRPSSPPLTEDAMMNMWGCQYTYAVVEGGRSAHLTSLGADCKPGGEGDNKDQKRVWP